VVAILVVDSCTSLASAMARPHNNLNSYIVFYRVSYMLVSGQHSWELSCRSRITVPLQNVKKEITGLLRIPAGKHNIVI
jgi:hypothetical protein